LDGIEWTGEVYGNNFDQTLGVVGKNGCHTDLGGVQCRTRTLNLRIDSPFIAFVSCCL
jgi:hypothetical protein